MIISRARKLFCRTKNTISIRQLKQKYALLYSKDSKVEEVLAGRVLEVRKESDDVQFIELMNNFVSLPIVLKNNNLQDFEAPQTLKRGYLVQFRG